MKFYESDFSVSGKWINKKEIQTGMKAVIASEVEKKEDEFEGKPKTRYIGKLSVEGGEALNFEFNKPTMKAMVEAYGEESNEWQGEEGTLRVEDSRIAGRSVKIAYFIPTGYEAVDDESGFLVIRKVENGN